MSMYLILCLLRYVMLLYIDGDKLRIPYTQRIQISCEMSYIHAY